MFEGILGKPKERRTQLHFRDDGTFEFRKLEIEDTFLVERNKEEIVKGWKHFYRNQFPFAGFKSIKPDQVTLSYDRDIILDPYEITKDDEDNPEKSTRVIQDDTQRFEQRGVKVWLSSVGEARRLKMMANRAKSSSYNRIILFLGSALMVELLIIGLIIARGEGGG